MVEFGSLLRRSLHSTRYDRLADVHPRRDPYYPLAAGATSAPPPCLRRSTPYEPARFHFSPYDRPADVPPRRGTYHPVASTPFHPVAAGASSDAPPRLRCSTPYEPDRFHYSPYDRPSGAPPRPDLYYPVAVGAPSKAASPYNPAASVASSDATPPYYPFAASPYHPVVAGASSEAPPLYHPVAAGSSSDATTPYHPVASGTSSHAVPSLSTDAPRPSPYEDSEFPTIGPLFLPPNFDPVGSSSPPRCRPYDPTIIGPIPAGAAYHGVIDATKYDLRRSSSSRARRGTTVCPLCNTKGYHLPTCCPYMVVATELEIFRSRPPNNLRYQHYFVEGRQGVHGCGIGSYAPPRLDVAERAPEIAVSLHKDGLNLVRITNLPVDIKPEALYKLFDKFGPVTNAIIFIDLSFGFVNFVRVEDAEKAMKELNSSGFGHLMWASETPQ